MVDFAQMGTVLGAQAAIAQVVADGEQTIAEKDRALFEHQAALTVEQLHAAGLKAQVAVLKSELARLDPGNRLLRKTGRHFNDGEAETVLSQVYYKGFDEAGVRKRVPNPSTLRARAK